MSVVDHYAVLGVRHDAQPDELREAYRRAARAAHPDRHGPASAERMAAVNEAWRVLGDPALRRRYDEMLAAARNGGGSSATSPSSRPPVAERPPIVAQVPPSRFPWRFLLSMAVIGVVAVLIGSALTEPGDPAQPDGILRGGDCVVVGLDAAEVSCAGPYDGVVRTLVPFDQQCPADTQPYRDRQGMGIACVLMGPAG